MLKAAGIGGRPLLRILPSGYKELFRQNISTTISMSFATMEPYLDNPSRKPESLSPYTEADLAAVRLAAEAKASRRRKARRVWRVLHGLTLIGVVIYLASRYVSFHKHGAGYHGHNALAQVGCVRIFRLTVSNILFHPGKSANRKLGL